ncbi:hypothetical protein SAMN05216371_6538 [Streptomyces sp. TLI_053]|nr:hypothetical protein SAMN05216371_6538 [Streptomyces sp. TLI_053]
MRTRPTACNGSTVGARTARAPGKRPRARDAECVAGPGAYRRYGQAVFGVSVQRWLALP